MQALAGNPELTTQLSRTISETWGTLAAGWPLELGLSWQRAELGRITRRHLEVTVSDSGGPAFGARVLLLDGHEQRTGYHLRDLLAGEDVRAAAARLGRPGRASSLTREIGAVDEMLSPWRHALTASAAAPGCYVPSVLHRAGLSEGELAAILGGLKDATPATLSMVVIPNLPADGCWRQLAKVLGDSGYVRVAQPPSVTLQVPGNGWEGYLASFRSNRRREVNRERNRFLAQVTDVAFWPEIPPALMDDAVALLGERFAKFGHHEPPDRVRDRLNRFLLVDPAGFIIAQRNGELVGFTAVAVDHAHGRLIPRLGAVRADVPFAYFNLTFYELLSWAHRLALGSIELGTQAYKAKLLRGAVLARRAAFMYPVDPALRPVLDHAAEICGRIFSEEEDELTASNVSHHP